MPFIPYAIVLSIAATSLVACGGAPSESSGTQASDLTGWQQTLTCNGGAAMVDVNPSDRRALQLVIRDPRAINYLTGAVGNQLRLNRGNGRELIVGGFTDRGVFSSGDFQWLSSPQADLSGEAVAYREGAGIRVVFRRNDGPGGRECVEWSSDPALANPVCVQWRDNGGAGSQRELANWYFDRCN